MARVARRLRPLTTQELFVALATLPGSRAVPVGSDGIEESRLVAGVEIARTRAAQERDLRRTWRERHGGGAAPLLLLTDDPERADGVRALGPVQAGTPIRAVSAEALLRVLEALPARSPLHAVRTLAEELERLDQIGISGLVVRGLGTEYLYISRLRSSPLWADLDAWSAGAGGEWRDVVAALGYAVERLPVRGHLLRHEGRPVAVVRPFADAADFARLDADGRPPEGVLIEDCVQAGARYGVLAAGSRLRLFDAQPASGSAVGQFLELDAAALDARERPLLGLLAPPMLAGDGFERLMDDSRAFGTALRQRLDIAIRQVVLPPLALELGRWARREGSDVTNDDVRAELEAAALTWVFRVLFLLYAESSGFLPIDQEAYRPHSLTRIVEDATHGGDVHATSLWRRVGLLVEAMRTGNTAWGVPPYNGQLFAADGFAGARLLDRAAASDAALAPALAALARDPETGTGVDFSSLAIGHLGHIYEGLLSLRLSVADRPMSYDAATDRYIVDEETPEIPAGDLLWLTDEGGRKGGGVYYTPEPLVRHLVRRGVGPAFERHLRAIRELAESDPAAAGERLFEFRVLDPACGSAHFLVAVVDELADQVARFLARTPLPAVRSALEDLRAGARATFGVGADDVPLLRRLVLKRCVYGVDRSAMGAEIAKVSLWLEAFVPGLALGYLDHNVQVGDSLVGVASVEHLRDPGERHGQIGLAAQAVRDAVAAGARSAAELARLGDRTPEEVAASRAADARLHDATAGARRLLHLWVAEPLGVDGARAALWSNPHAVLAGESRLAERAARVAERAEALHWPLAFPEAFADDRPGFDAVVGNPPWEEVTVEELAFFARYRPGLRGMAEGPRGEALAQLERERPDLRRRLEDEQAAAAAQRAYFAADPAYTSTAGDPDLYKFFCQRYRSLLRDGGQLAVVLPRSTFLVQGSADFRRWLSASTTVERVDFLLNRARWAFDAEPRYTVALLIARAEPPAEDHIVRVAGVATSRAAFAAQSASQGIALAATGLGPAGEVPLLPSQAAADLLPRLAAGTRFPFGGGRWTCFPVSEFHETHDRGLWRNATEGRPLWKGESFDRYAPTGAEERPCPPSAAALRKQRKSRPAQRSAVAAHVPVAERAAAAQAELTGPRVAFRDVSRSTDSRTVRAALVPPEVFLTNTAPYLVFVEGGDRARAACLGVMNSLPFDWQARRYVETHLNYFILELLAVPKLDDDAYEQVACAAARLSCVDDRYAEFARVVGVDHGPLDADERARLEAEIDALVCVAWDLAVTDLEVMVSDFTRDAVTDDYRDRVRARLRELGG